MKKEQRGATRSMALTSLLLVLIALAAVTAVTVAWFSISNRTRVYSMNMDVTTGAALRFDLDAHDDFLSYASTLSSEAIYARIPQEYGFDPAQSALTPVTTTDGRTFALQDGTVQEASSGAFLKFTLHFMATEDMIVHLTSAHSSGSADGTLISSSLSQLPAAMRISFTHGEKTVIFDPGATNNYYIGGNILVFGLPQAEHMLYNDENGLFRISPDTDEELELCVWMEGSDEACTDAVRNGDFSIRLRFVGTDEDNRLI